MHRVIKTLSMVFSGLIGVDWAITGYRYLVFFSGGSGFVVPVPGSVVILLILGLVMVGASVLSIWLPRLGATSCIAALFAATITTIFQTINHARPSEVILRRSGFVVLYVAVSATLYWVWLRKKATHA